MASFNQNVIKHKTGLLNLAAELGNISKACKIMGFSRDTFYRYQTARDAGGVEALFDVSRKKPNLKNRVEEATELAVLDFAIAFPAHGQVRASNELRKEGVIFEWLFCLQLYFHRTVEHCETAAAEFRTLFSYPKI